MVGSVERRPDGSASCTVSGVFSLYLTVAPDKSARATFKDHKLYGNGAAWLYTTAEFTRSASGRIQYSLAEFEIMHPNFTGNEQFGKTTVILDGAKSYALHVPKWKIERTTMSTFRSVVSDFRHLGPDFLAEFGRAREVKVQLNYPSGQPYLAMDTNNSGAGYVLDRLNRANWSCG